MKIPEDTWLYVLFFVHPVVYSVYRSLTRSPEKNGMRRTVNPKRTIDRHILRKGPEEPYSKDRKINRHFRG